MEWISNPSAWIALLTLTVLEIVLGIDNIIFISILSNRLPENQQGKARQTGLLAALGMRVGPDKELGQHSWGNLFFHK